jgi:hypothetical protein
VAVATTLTVLLVAYLSFPVTGVKVEGARMYDESNAVNAVPDHASLLTLNNELLEDRVESNVWVEERRPMLHAEVDGTEVVLSSDGRELPGPGGAGLERMSLDRDQVGEILDFARTLHENGIRVDSVDEVDAGGIRATVEDRAVIFSTNVDDRQAEALRDIMPEHPYARLFDLRSPDRVVVSVQGNTKSDFRG